MFFNKKTTGEAVIEEALADFQKISDKLTEGITLSAEENKETEQKLVAADEILAKAKKDHETVKLNVDKKLADQKVITAKAINVKANLEKLMTGKL